MTAVEILDFSLKLVTLVAIIGGGGVIVFRMGRMTEKFELIGVQQSREISELKTGMSKVEGVLIAMANQNGRIDRVEDRQSNQGARIDSLNVRFNALVDNSYVRTAEVA